MEYKCVCGENRTEFIKVEFVDEDGNVVILVPDVDGVIAFGELSGKYSLYVTNDEGEELANYEITLEKNEPSQPTEPEPPVTPSEPDEPNVPTNPETPTEPSGNVTPDGSHDTDKTDSGKSGTKNVSAAAVLLPVLSVLGIGGGVVYYFIVKKNKTRKTKRIKKSNNEKENK